MGRIVRGGGSAQSRGVPIVSERSLVGGWEEAHFRELGWVPDRTNRRDPAASAVCFTGCLMCLTATSTRSATKRPIDNGAAATCNCHCNGYTCD